MITRRSLLEGLAAGALGYVVVAAFFAFLNVVTGASPFRTAFLIGQALGAGAAGPGEVAGIILAANGIHLLLSLWLGVIAAWLLQEVEAHHELWVVVLMIFIAGFLFMVLVAGIAGAELTRIATWGEVTAAGFFFTAVVGAFLAWRHRLLTREIDQEAESW